MDKKYMSELKLWIEDAEKIGLLLDDIHDTQKKINQIIFSRNPIKRILGFSRATKMIEDVEEKLKLVDEKIDSLP